MLNNPLNLQSSIIIHHSSLTPLTHITLHHTLPRVFEQRSDIHSEIWQQDVTFNRGSFYLIQAASGTGKSSLCSFLTGYRRDYSGSICFDGHDISSLRTGDWTALRQRSLSHVFQELRLFPELTAWENVQIKNQLTRHKTEAEIADWFQALGIADKRDVKLARMSFGQQQRVAILRALCQPFDFLLADEPVSHLDQDNCGIVRDIIMQEARQQGAGVIVTSIGYHMDLPYEQRIEL